MNRIKIVLEQKGVKQTWLAERLNKSYNMVNSYVQNRRQPSLKDLSRIAKILRVEVNELLDKDTFRNRETYSVPLASQFHVKDSEPTYAQTVKIPLLGNVACGSPLFAQENIEAEVSVSVKFIKPNHKFFILRVSGDSMDEKGINDGDLVLIRHQQTAENGQDVVALIDNEATIKEFHHRGNMIILKPRSKNNEHQPIILTNDFRIQGVVETVITI